MIDQHTLREEEGAVKVAVTSDSLKVAMSTAGVAAKSREKGAVWYFPLNQYVCVCVGGGVMWLCFYYSAVMIRSYDGQHLNTTHYLARYI